MRAQHHDVVIVGSGLAGIVTALECLRAGQSVALIDRDTPECALAAGGGESAAAENCALSACLRSPARL
ncbi:FAD-dependent oxidoreductase [Acidovorax sp. JHL-9]|uniref:FAD-dependent oxidoreductase n=1 Tax=Acidovorax sp. JHL-9 TaxID=1276756 RepID=UPI000403494C|nr:FAD-dependent oxidoreductase [Acidovorax sp. JHL-9]